MNKKLTHVRLDDWEALYVDGVLIEQTHSIEWEYLLPKILGFDIEHLWLGDNEEILEEVKSTWNNRLPGKLEDITNALSQDIRFKFNLKYPTHKYAVGPAMADLFKRWYDGNVPDLKFQSEMKFLAQVSDLVEAEGWHDV